MCIVRGGEPDPLITGVALRVADENLRLRTVRQGGVNAVEQFAVVQRLLEDDPESRPGRTITEIIADPGSDEDRGTVDPALSQFLDKLNPGMPGML
jgi:hypothetical protein